MLNFSLLNWSPDGKSVLIAEADPQRFEALDVASGNRTLLVRHEKYPIHDGILSPDGRWLAFKLVTSASIQPVYVTALGNGAPAAEKDWIKISGDYNQTKPFWSPDGELLYYLLRRGRMIVPVWLNDRIKGNYRSAVMFSDDRGATWKAGGIVPPVAATNANECMLYERRDGAVMVSLRSSVHQRHTAASRDGGQTWSEPKPVDGIPDPVCQASILALPKGRVVFANPASDKRRVNMTLRLSQDDGATWPIARPLYEGPSGYSDLASGKDGAIFCLFEYGAKGSAEKIRFARIPRGWLRP